MSDSDRLPEWAEWVEDDEDPNLVSGVECRVCQSRVWSSSDHRPRDEYPVENVTTVLIHEDDCKHSDREVDE